MGRRGTTTRPVDGFARAPGGASVWREARFALDTGPGSQQLLLHHRDEPDGSTIDLAAVTALDELRSDLDGLDVVEIAVDHEPVVEAAWPGSFTAAVLDALRATLDPTGAVSADDAPPAGRGRALTGTIAALALVGVGAMITGALSLDTEPPPSTTTEVLSQSTVRPTQTATSAGPLGNRTTQAPTTTSTTTFAAPTTEAPTTTAVGADV